MRLGRHSQQEPTVPIIIFKYMETLNFNENCILGNSELIPWNKSLRQDLSALLQNMGTIPYGIMENYNADSLKVTYDSQIGGYTTIQLGVGGSIVGSEYKVDPVISGVTLNGITSGNSFVYSQGIVNFYQIPGIGSFADGTVKYVDIVPSLTVFEEGTCSISPTGQVNFSSDKIVKKLRSQNSNSPTKLVFFTDNATKFNGGEIFEVIDIFDASSVVITGEFATTYSNLYCAIVGSYDIQSQPSLADTYLYAYIRPEIYIQDEADSLYGGVRLAKLTFAADQSFTIEDIRYQYRYNILPEGWTSIGAALYTDPVFATYVNLAQPYSFLARSIGKGKLEVQGSFYPTAACVSTSFQISTSEAGLYRVVSAYKSVSRVCDILSQDDLSGLIDLITPASTGNYVRVDNNITVGDSLNLFFNFGATVSTSVPSYFSVETNSMEVL